MYVYACTEICLHFVRFISNYVHSYRLILLFNNFHPFSSFPGSYSPCNAPADFNRQYETLLKSPQTRNVSMGASAADLICLSSYLVNLKDYTNFHFLFHRFVDCCTIPSTLTLTGYALTNILKR